MTLRQTIESTLDDNQTLHVKQYGAVYKYKFYAYIETNEKSGIGRKGVFGVTEQAALENLAAMLDLPKFDDGTVISLNANGIINLAVGAVCCLFFAGLIWAALLIDQSELAWTK